MAGHVGDSRRQGCRLGVGRGASPDRYNPARLPWPPLIRRQRDGDRGARRPSRCAGREPRMLPGSRSAHADPRSQSLRRDSTRSGEVSPGRTAVPASTDFGGASHDRSAGAPDPRPAAAPSPPGTEGLPLPHDAAHDGPEADRLRYRFGRVGGTADDPWGFGNSLGMGHLLPAAAGTPSPEPPRIRSERPAFELDSPERTSSSGSARSRTCTRRGRALRADRR